MSDETGTFATIRRRKTPSQLLRPSSNDNSSMSADVTQGGGGNSSKRFPRWSACFGFVSKLKRPKSKFDFPLTEKLEQLTTTLPLSKKGPQPSLESPYLISQSDQQQERSLATAASVLQRSWKDQHIPLQVASPLSPPPRHAMKERSRSMTLDNTTPCPISSSPLLPKEEPQETLTPSSKRKATTIGPAFALRLSLDIEQQYSSSASSTSDLRKKDEQDDTSSCASSSGIRGVVAPDHKFWLSSNEMSVNSSPSPPGGQQAEKRLSLIERRQRTSATIPDIEKLNISYNESVSDDRGKIQDEEDDDYQNLLSEFQLPSEALPPPPSSSSFPASTAAKENQGKQEETQRWHCRLPIPFGGTPKQTSRDMSRQQAMDALEGKGGGVRPMDVGRDKAYYDAVVAGTLHRRPWTQSIQIQSTSVRDEQEGLVHEKGGHYFKASSVTMLKHHHHHPSLVYFPPSPNSINYDHEP